MQFEQNKPLKYLNTLAFEHIAEHYVEAQSEDDLAEAREYALNNNWPLFVLGGGSNIVLTQDIKGLVVHPVGSAISYQTTDTDEALVTANAGANWHELVLDTLQHGYAGLENLSLIPGAAGAAPVQNIGAYGIELKHRLVSLRALHLPSGEWRTFTNKVCEFDYRNSLFKRLKGDYAISSISLQLSKSLPLNTHYAALQQAIDAAQLKEVDAKAISNLVCQIRSQKLPDPDVLSNVGSFFQNPIIDDEHYQTLKADHPGLVAYPQADGQVKLAAGWLIDTLGFRGKRSGAVGVHDKQALVLVNFGGGTGEQLLTLAEDIRQSVKDNFDVELRIEPNVM